MKMEQVARSICHWGENKFSSHILHKAPVNTSRKYTYSIKITHCSLLYPRNTHFPPHSPISTTPCYFQPHAVLFSHPNIHHPLTVWLYRTQVGKKSRWGLWGGLTEKVRWESYPRENPMHSVTTVAKLNI